jgi:hypothetical protein
MATVAVGELARHTLLVAECDDANPLVSYRQMLATAEFAAA